MVLFTVCEVSDGGHTSIEVFDQSSEHQGMISSINRPLTYTKLNVVSLKLIETPTSVHIHTLLSDMTSTHDGKSYVLYAHSK